MSPENRNLTIHT